MALVSKGPGVSMEAEAGGGDGGFPSPGRGRDWGSSRGSWKSTNSRDGFQIPSGIRKESGFGGMIALDGQKRQRVRQSFHPISRAASLNRACSARNSGFGDGDRSSGDCVSNSERAFH